MAPIRLALFGSGNFARDAHLPSLKALGDTFEVVAIYSHNEENAKALAATLPGNVTATSDADSLLARKDIDAVDIILPIPVQPAFVEAALRAGKHVISEKPISPDVATGKQLIQTAAPLIQKTGLVWLVAENMRYEDAFKTAGETIRRGDIGKPIQLSWITSAGVTPQSKGYQTLWRRDNSFPGGFLMDGGVHSVAVIRAVMGEIESLSAFTASVRQDLPPVETASVALRFDSGALGNLTTTYATQAPWDNYVYVIGEHGALRVNSKQLEITIDGKTTAQSFQINNVQTEFADFAHAIQHGGGVVSTPLSGLQDVAVIEAILESGRTGGTIKPVRVV